MTAFVRGVPQTTKEPSVTVDAGLKPGVHRFNLVVVDDADRASAPDEVLIQVQNLAAPPLIIQPIGITAPIGTIAPIGTTAPIGIAAPIGTTAPIRSAAPTGGLSPVRPRTRRSKP